MIRQVLAKIRDQGHVTPSNATGSARGTRIIPSTQLINVQSRLMAFLGIHSKFSLKKDLTWSAPPAQKRAAGRVSATVAEYYMDTH